LRRIAAEMKQIFSSVSFQFILVVRTAKLRWVHYGNEPECLVSVHMCGRLK